MAKSTNNKTPAQKRAATSKATLNESLSLRAVQMDDLTEPERKRQDRMRKETSLNAPLTAAAAMEPDKNPNLRAKLMLAQPKAESRKQIVSRLSDQVMNPDQSLRLPGEQVVPGADWYPRVHGVPLRRISQHYEIDPETGANSSGSMSPQNSPENERAAFSAIAKAHSKNATSHITPDVLDLMPAGSPVRNLPVGPVKFRDMTPEQVRDLTQASVRDATIPTNDGPPQAVLQSEIDLKRIAKAGTNKVSGVLGVRGASNVELNPPASAPKVNTYTNHGFVFGVPHTESDHKNETQSTFLPETETAPPGRVKRGKYVPLHPSSDPRLADPEASDFGGPDDNSTAQELRFRSSWAATQIPGQTMMDQFGLHDDRFVMTKAIHDHVTGRGGTVRGKDIGRTVRMRDLHSSAVMALSHPSLSRATDDASRISQLTKVSSQLPPVIDTWAMAGIHNYEGDLHKPAGVYQTGKTLSDGTPILNSTNAAITEKGLQHAEYGASMRDAAKETADRMRSNPARSTRPVPPVDPANDPDYPSTIVQGASWIENRRREDADPAFNKAEEERRKATNAAHAEAVATKGTFSVPPEQGQAGPSRLVAWSDQALPGMKTKSKFALKDGAIDKYVPLPKGDPHIPRTSRKKKQP